MADKKFREEYGSIKAPEELYGRIMNARKDEVKSTVQPFRKIVAAAASFAVILTAAVAMLTYDKSPEIYVGGTRLTGEIELTEKNNDGLMLARAGNEVSCEFNFSFDRETTVSLSDGILLSENGTVISASDEEKSFKDSLLCKWVIGNADNGKTYEMKLSDGRKNYLITLFFDSVDGQWTAALTE